MGGHRANGPAPAQEVLAPMRKESSQKRPLVKTNERGIYKRGNRYVVVYRDPAGKQRKRFAKTLAEARVVKASLSTDMHRGEYVEEAKISFSDYARRWIASYEGRTARGIRESTLADYRHALGLRLDDDGQLVETGGGALAHFGRMPLRTIRAQDLKEYAARVAATGAAKNTVRLRIAPVRAMLADAFEEGVIRSNPAAGLRLGRAVASAPVKETNALTEEEVALLLDQVPETHRLIVEFLVTTGLRISEALALRKSDIDFGGRRLSVSRRLYEGRLDEPKSRHGVRRVPLSAPLARKLWRRLLTESDDALVFANANGEPLDPGHLYRVVRKAGEKAGIVWPVGLHALRHSCRTIMFRRGVPKEAIRKLLGHHSWEFTAGTYLHLDDDDLPDGDVLADLLGGNGGSNTGAKRPAETARDAVAAEEAV
jgi:integrase